MVDAGRPMTERNFDAELRAEEAARQAAGIPPGIQRSVWARLQAGRHGARSRRPAGAIAAAVALMAVAVGVVATLVALRPAARLGDLEVARRSDDLAAGVDGGVVAIERGAAILIDRPSGLTIATAGQVSLRREPRGVRLLHGHIDVTATHRPAGAAPAAILVSHGAIEVMGTAFTVVQEPAGGRVTLREGSIRFQAADGREVSLRPGEALAWPLSPPAPPPPALPAPAPPPPAPPTSRMPRSPSAPGPTASASRAAAATPPPPATDLALLDRIDELRSRRKFEPAARALRRAIPLQPEPMRERLSFELGSLLTHQIGDARRACAHWAAHDRHYPDGRYRDEVARSRRALGCPTPSGGR
jgi:transmembrane sensor